MHNHKDKNVKALIASHDARHQHIGGFIIQKILAVFVEPTTPEDVEIYSSPKVHRNREMPGKI